MHDLTRLSKNLSAAVSCLEQISVNTKALLDKQISIDENLRIIASGREPEKWYTQKEVAALLHVTRQTVRNWSKSGKLKPCSPDGHLYAAAEVTGFGRSQSLIP